MIYLIDEPIELMLSWYNIHSFVVVTLIDKVASSINFRVPSQPVNWYTTVVYQIYYCRLSDSIDALQVNNQERAYTNGYTK